MFSNKLINVFSTFSPVTANVSHKNILFCLSQFPTSWVLNSFVCALLVKSALFLQVTMQSSSALCLALPITCLHFSITSAQCHCRIAIHPSWSVVRLHDWYLSSPTVPQTCALTRFRNFNYIIFFVENSKPIVATDFDCILFLLI